MHLGLYIPTKRLYTYTGEIHETKLAHKSGTIFSDTDIKLIDDTYDIDYDCGLIDGHVGYFGISINTFDCDDHGHSVTFDDFYEDILDAKFQLYSLLKHHSYNSEQVGQLIGKAKVTHVSRVG